jgi:predicted Zn-ribbon and HTH transcriptional regulator
MTQVIHKSKCLRCGHRWWPATPKVPKVCPGCHSPYWGEPRKKPRIIKPVCIEDDTLMPVEEEAI